jgi:hypothetical protein
MKRSLTFSFACLLLVSACSSPAQDKAKTETATATASQQNLVVALNVSCATLIGDDGGLLKKSGEFLKNVEKLSVETGEKAKGFSDDFSEVARTAQDELREPIAIMRKPLDGLAAAVEDGTDFKFALNDFSVAGTKIIESCSGDKPKSASAPVQTPTSAPAGLSYKLSCSIKTANSTAFTNYKAAWSQPFDLCYPTSASGTASPAEKEAATGYSKDLDGAKHLYGLCAMTAGHYVEGSVSSSQAKEITRALTLCPDHPKRAQLEANAASALAEESDSTSGKLVGPGKYLVGKTIQPGTWQSQGEKVEDCYWEISDAQGNIIKNNFISVAPQFTIAIPPTASGFTATGCSFRWISG